MSDCSIFDVVDVTSYLLALLFCCTKVRVTENNVGLLGGIFLIRVFIGLIMSTAEFLAEILTFRNETNQTFFDAYQDGLISAHLFHCYILFFVVMGLICFAMMLTFCKFSKLKNSTGYWRMIYIFKIPMFMLDVTMFLFCLLLTLFYGGELIEISASSISKTVVSIIFLIKCVDLFLDLLFIIKDFLSCVGCCG